jgi:hypothetical protein
MTWCLASAADALFLNNLRVLCDCAAGHETEWGFYRAMIKGGRNNLALLSMMGLLAIPSIAAGVAILQR